MAKTTLDIHSGHRERMRNKFRMHSANTMENYELLEMLLYHVAVQGDTHPIAKHLLFEFGSIDGVFKADKEALMRVDDGGFSNIVISHAIDRSKLLPRERSFASALFYVLTRRLSV